MNHLKNLMESSKTNRATLEFFLGLYYYYTDNPVWYICRANAIKAMQEESLEWGVWCVYGRCWFNQNMDGQWGTKAQMKSKAHGLNALYNPGGQYEARPRP